MTDLTATERPSHEAQVRPVALPVGAPATVELTVITEQQVLFATAAATLPVPKRRWAGVIMSAFGAVGSWVVEAARPPASQPGSVRRMYLENASMAREMYRL